MGSQEKYLKPAVIQSVRRLDLRAKFIIEGFISGLHRSPFHGFSSEFSEHRKYEPGDEIRDIDWRVFARTDRYYIKRFRAETNLTCFLALDLSASMDYTFRQELTKFEYSISLAAALTYLMVYQSDAVGLVTFDTQVRHYLKPSSRRRQLSDVIALLSQLKPTGETDIARSLSYMASLVRHRSLVVLFSDLLSDPEPVMKAVRILKHRGNDVIVFHVLDEAEATFPFHGLVELRDKETPQREVVDADGVRAEYLKTLAEFQEQFRRDCIACGADYVPIHTGMQFDKALSEYLSERGRRG